LARPYRAFMALARESESANYQCMDGSALPAEALAALCAQSLITSTPRPDLEVQRSLDIATAYRVPDSAKRASFLPEESVAFVGDELVLDRFRHGVVELAGRMFLAPGDRPSSSPSSERPPDGAPSPRVEYRRPGSDAIVVRMESARPGYLRVVESWDPG